MTTGTAASVGHEQLQEVYRHLDHCDHGDRFIAWYGQCRAKEMSHQEALADTIEHFRLKDAPWYQRRFPESGDQR